MAKQIKKVKFSVTSPEAQSILSCVDEKCSVNSMYDIMYNLRRLAMEFRKSYGYEPTIFHYEVLGD